MGFYSPPITDCMFLSTKACLNWRIAYLNICGEEVHIGIEGCHFYSCNWLLWIVRLEIWNAQQNIWIRLAKKKHFDGKLVYFVFVGKLFLGDKISLEMAFSFLLSFSGIQGISVRRHIFPRTLFTYCIHISNPLNKQERLSAGRGDSEMPIKNLACPRINTSTERHLRFTLLQSAAFSTNANSELFQFHFYMSH